MKKKSWRNLKKRSRGREHEQKARKTASERNNKKKRRTIFAGGHSNGIFCLYSLCFHLSRRFLAAAATDVALIARCEIIGCLCHLLKALIKAEKVCAELLGHFETLVLVALTLLNARVVLIRRHFAFVIADCAGARVRGRNWHSAGAAYMSLGLCDFFDRCRHFQFGCFFHRVVILFPQDDLSLGILLLAIATPQQIHLHCVQNIVQIKKVCVDERVAYDRCLLVMMMMMRGCFGGLDSISWVTDLRKHKIRIGLFIWSYDVFFRARTLIAFEGSYTSYESKFR